MLSRFELHQSKLQESAFYAPTSTCPGLFYAVSAQDGTLIRIRTPGGRISSSQGKVLANLAKQVGNGWLQVTNRANLQIRAVDDIPAATLSQLQAAGLAAPASVDHLRNIMASPTAGIDPAAIYDTRPLVQALNLYIATHPELTELSAKFSVAVDGGETISIRDRPNDLKLVATAKAQECWFRLFLNTDLNTEQSTELDLGILLHPQDCVKAVGALAQVYLEQTKHLSCSKKPRLREVIRALGIDAYYRATQPFAVSSPHPSEHLSLAVTYAPIGRYPQRHPGYSYLGLGLPLGWLSAAQLQAVAWLARKYGSSELRLTPWQTLLLPDIPDSQIDSLQNEITGLGLSTFMHDPYSGLVACAGNIGCAAAATNTRRDAMQLAAQLEQFSRNYAINIHFTGCPKSCAQHHPSDIALLGTTVEQAGILTEAYHIYIGSSEKPFGRLLYQNIVATEIPALIQQILSSYQINRAAPTELFSEFVNRHDLEELVKQVENICQEQL